MLAFVRAEVARVCTPESCARALESASFWTRLGLTVRCGFFCLQEMEVRKVGAVGPRGAGLQRPGGRIRPRVPVYEIAFQPDPPVLGCSLYRGLSCLHPHRVGTACAAGCRSLVIKAQHIKHVAHEQPSWCAEAAADDGSPGGPSGLIPAPLMHPQRRRRETARAGAVVSA